MKRNKPGIARKLSVALVLAGLALAGMAQATGRVFTGYYGVSDVSVSEDTATFKLTVLLLNHSGVDVSNATVTLIDWTIPVENNGKFSSVSIRTGKAVRLRGTFQVTQREYEGWQEGRRPRLVIEYADASGNNVRLPIEVHQKPIRAELSSERQ